MEKITSFFKTPSALSAAIVVPTGKVTVCGDIATVEMWKDNKIVDVKVNTLDTYPAVVCDGKLGAEYALKICALVEMKTVCITLFHSVMHRTVKTVII